VKNFQAGGFAMPRAKPAQPRLGQVTLRLDPEKHRRLIEIAGHLGVDTTVLIREMIESALPEFEVRAEMSAQKKRRADQLVRVISIRTALIDAMELDVANPEGVSPRTVKLYRELISGMRGSIQTAQRGLFDFGDTDDALGRLDRIERRLAALDRKSGRAEGDDPPQSQPTPATPKPRGRPRKSDPPEGG
jgi:hypothetical protein